MKLLNISFFVIVLISSSFKLPAMEKGLKLCKTDHIPDLMNQITNLNLQTSNLNPAICDECERFAAIVAINKLCLDSIDLWSDKTCTFESDTLPEALAPFPANMRTDIMKRFDYYKKILLSRFNIENMINITSSNLDVDTSTKHEKLIATVVIDRLFDYIFSTGDDIEKILPTLKPYSNNADFMQRIDFYNTNFPFIGIKDLLNKK